MGQQVDVEKETKKRTAVATHTEIARMYWMKRMADTLYSRGQFYRYGEGVWEPIHDLLISRELWRHLTAYEEKGVRPTRDVKNSVGDAIKAELFIPEDCLDANENLVNLANGIYDLSTQTLLPHNPAQYLTTQLPFAYDAQASAVTWQMYLMSTFVKPRSVEYDQELAEFVQEAVGYSLTTSVCHHCTFWCYGEGANGKGVLFHVLEQLGGTACTPLNVGILGREQYQLASLAGKRIALCTEASATKNLVADDYVKMLVAGDSMPVRQIRKEPFTLTPTVHLWWAMNELPAVADSSEGFWRRVMVVPFNRQFATNERILDMKERLIPELPGIFNWAMQGLKRLRDRGRFVLPSQVAESTKQYRQDANPVALFIADECYEGKDLKEQSSVLYDAYKAWCFTNNYKPHSSRNFKHEMERLNHHYKPETAFRTFMGVTLKIPPPKEKGKS